MCKYVNQFLSLSFSHKKKKKIPFIVQESYTWIYYKGGKDEEASLSFLSPLFLPGR